VSASRVTCRNSPLATSFAHCRPSGAPAAFAEPEAGAAFVVPRERKLDILRTDKAVCFG
jgi:hypothetical protein